MEVGSFDYLEVSHSKYTWFGRNSKELPPEAGLSYFQIEQLMKK